MNELRVLVETRDDKGKADIVFPSSPGPSGHLVEICRRKICEIMSVVAIALDQNHRSRRKIYSCRDGGGRKDGVQVAPVHHFFYQHLPIGELSGMM